MSSYPNLFQPGRIGALEIPNRIVFAATSTELADGEGLVTDEMIEFYGERARGGTGLIVVEATYVDQEGKRLKHNLMLHEDGCIPGMTRLVDAVHQAGARIALQINHGGRESVPEVSGSVPLAPSAQVSGFTGVGDAVIPRELTIAEIEGIVGRFADAAARAQQAGFDAVEIHGAHGYLAGQFLSPVCNTRQDRYGHDTAGRAQFGVELVRAIKARTGDDYPVIFRMNGRDHVPGGLELDAAVESAVLFAAAGADAISVSGGQHASRPYMIVPGMATKRACYADYSAAVRARLDVPVMTVGRINTPDLAEDILERGDADYICLSRGLIADPYFGAKAKAGKAGEIAPCIACNECIATIHLHKGLACTVNPMVSRELALKPILARQVTPKRLAVIGGGAAGMAAATMAAKRGHAVQLFEKAAQLGGQLNLAHQPPHREEIGRLLDYLRSEVERLGIQVNLNATPGPDELQADALIIGIGAEPVQTQVPGAELADVLYGWRVLAGSDKPGQNCVVVGGGLVGVEVADMLAEQGRNIVLVARSELLRKAVHVDKVHYLDRMDSFGIEVMTHTRVVEIRPGEVVLQPEGRLRRTVEGVDSIIYCTGYHKREDEALPYEALDIPVHYVGDVLGSRKFFQAIEEGTLAALEI
ncbi:MAG: NADH:flavin oxidoreductase [Alphaproteobacteria bacterium]|jgi:2,4-dienoyl-CoA reductase-like NADH-dependent reductase (Old Yellow Enzyme family)/thioredoxin reductase|nr:NADH:flavin oxidoreductase [Alphaproteobacteria bacterium]MDP6874715.1 NADH:flavin oxidoreductase [Alphaproteobacteria bacterium]